MFCMSSPMVCLSYLGWEPTKSHLLYNLWKLTLRGHLNTDVQAGLELGTFRYENDALTARPQLHRTVTT